MARIRTIKPEFFTSEDIVALSPLARLLYIAIWCEADKEGRLEWRPGTFKLRYLPADACDAHALADELVQRGLVVLYGDGLAYIPQFARHQHLNPREAASRLPAPDGTDRSARTSITEDQNTAQVVDLHGAEPDASARVVTRRDASARVGHAQVGREGKGREHTPPIGGDAHERARDAPPDPAADQPTATPAPPGSARTRPRTPPCPDDVPAEVWRDWLALRRAKRAPVTETVLASARVEADKAGMRLADFLAEWCNRGSQGLKAEWLLRDAPRGAAGPPGRSAESFRERDRRLAAERVAEFAPSAADPSALRGGFDIVEMGVVSNVVSLAGR